MSLLEPWPAVFRHFHLIGDSVAVGAFHFGVFALKFKTGVATVVKLETVFPSFRAVTRATIFSCPLAHKMMLVVFLVATHARTLLTKKPNIRRPSGLRGSRFKMAL